MKIDVKVDIADILESYEITNLGILSVAKNGTKSKYIADDGDEFPEGKELIQLHKRKERSSKVVLKKKEKVLHESGKLECEVCGFDFVKIYGQLGYGFAECHHTVPVSELTVGHKTKLSDLAIVCANCHQMLHKARPLISIGELRAVVKKNADK